MWVITDPLLPIYDLSNLEMKWLAILATKEQNTTCIVKQLLTQAKLRLPENQFFCLQHKATFVQVVLAFSKSQPTAGLRVDGLGSTDKGLGFRV